MPQNQPRLISRPCLPHANDYAIALHCKAATFKRFSVNLTIRINDMPKPKSVSRSNCPLYLATLFFPGGQRLLGELLQKSGRELHREVFVQRDLLDKPQFFKRSQEFEKPSAPICNAHCVFSAIGGLRPL